jgi:hypothetical protein
MNQTFSCGEYRFTIGGDDGVRLSVDGGSTWIIDDYSNHGYRTVNTTEPMTAGTYNLVLEYYEQGGGNQTSFDYSYSGPLPIELISFEPTVLENQFVQLDWLTATETDNDFYSIERSADAEHWEVIQLLDGAGTTTESRSYSWIDRSPLPGTSYYRLKQTDFDGKFEYSEIRSVEITGLNPQTLEAFPNPAKFTLSLRGAFPRHPDYDVISTHGVRVTRRVSILQSSDGNLVLDISKLPAGNYVFRVGGEHVLINIVD